MTSVTIDSRLDLLLAEATTEVLETMCFFGLMGPADSLPATGDKISAALTFQGDVDGAFHVTLDLPAAWAIAANFIGEEPAEISQSQLEWLVCELANMICGSLLSKCKSDGHFELTSPKITGLTFAGLTFAGNDAPQNSHVLRRAFELESGNIAIVLTVRDTI